MAAKFFTGLPLDGPDPECVQGHSAPALVARAPDTAAAGRPLARAAGPPTGAADAVGQAAGSTAGALCNESPL